MSKNNILVFLLFGSQSQKRNIFAAGTQQEPLSLLCYLHLLGLLTHSGDRLLSTAGADGGLDSLPVKMIHMLIKGLVGDLHSAL